MAGFHLLFLLMISAAHSFQFPVGGRGGEWKLNPSVDYNLWAGRMRFQVNDTILFRYKQGADSVLEVNEADYQKCNTENPIGKWEDGNTVFKFNRSGPFFFISRNTSNCQNGEKLIIVVLAVRHSHPTAAAPSPVFVSPGESPAPSQLDADSPVGGAPHPHSSFATSLGACPLIVVVSMVSVMFWGFH